MTGERYYTFKGSVASVRFFALDSNYIDKEQLAWLEKELQGSASDWKICYFHHPLYSSGRMHGPSVDKREVLEPLLERYKVDVVFSGHEHFYERIKPQKGVHYFISGAGGKLRPKNIGKTEITEKGYDEDFHFMLVEITGDEMYFQTISRVGTTVDSGVIRRVPQQG
jgi:3',5'-cyclic AMP phosphodiesterase CpdA